MKFQVSLLVSVAEQAGLNFSLSENPKTDFQLVSTLNDSSLDFLIFAFFCSTIDKQANNMAMSIETADIIRDIV